MQTLLHAIKNVLRPNLLRGKPVTLEELDPGSTCEPILLPTHTSPVVLKPDQSYVGCPRPDCGLGLSANDRLFPLFNVKASGIGVVCDYMIFCQQRPEEPLFILLCELKSGDLGGSTKQIENGRLLADYILAMARHHGQVRILPSSIKARGIVFHRDGAKPIGNLHKLPCAYRQVSTAMDDMPIAYYRCGEEYPLAHFCA
jgi:hypothetical protein